MVCASLRPQRWELQVVCHRMGGENNGLSIVIILAMASTLLAMASNLIAMASNQSNSTVLDFIRSVPTREDDVPCGQDVAHTYGEFASFGRLDVTKGELKAWRSRFWRGGCVTDFHQTFIIS